MCGVTCFLVGQWGALCVDDIVGLVAGTLEVIAECLEVMKDTCCVTAVVWVGHGPEWHDWWGGCWGLGLLE